MRTSFIGPSGLCSVDGIVVAGKADIKRLVVNHAELPRSLKENIIAVLTIQVKLLESMVSSHVVA